MNSPYKFTDPLGLLASTTGACGTSCANSGVVVDGSAFSGTDTTLKKIFADMEKGRQDVQRQQKQQQKPKPSIPSSLLIHEEMHQNQTESSTTLGDVVFQADSNITGIQREGIVVPPNVPALEKILNKTDYYVSFRMEIVERESGETRNGYSYEISYNGRPDEGAVDGKQQVDNNGVIEIGQYKVASRTEGEMGYVSQLTGNVSLEKTGTITIYGSNGEKVAESSFKATVTTRDKSTRDYVIDIVETKRTVFTTPQQTWKRNP